MNPSNIEQITLEHAVEVGQQLTLRTDQGFAIGSFLVAELKESWILGDFMPAQGYQQHRSLFQRWTKSVNEMTLSTIDQIELEIETLGLMLFDQSGLCVPSLEIQIYDDSMSIKAAVKLSSE